MSYCAPRNLQKSEATAAKRTFLFHLTVTADGSDATGKTISGSDIVISKAGAAFGNAAGAVTEVSAGWYKVVLAAADLDTLGDLSILITEALCDSVRVTFQVVDYDPYTDLALVRGLLGGNTVIDGGAADVDGPAYDSAGMLTGARVRVFDTAANAAAATAGGSGETGELGTFTVAASGANGRFTLYRSTGG